MKQVPQTWIRTFYALVLVLLMLLLGGCVLSSHTTETKNISHNMIWNKENTKAKMLAKGTKVDDLDLSDTLVTEVPTKIEGWAKDKLEETRVLLYNEKEILISLKEMGIEVDTEKIVEVAKRSPGQVVSSVLKVESLATNQGIQERLEKFTQPPKDADYKIEKDKMVIEPSKSGRAVGV